MAEGRTENRDFLLPRLNLLRMVLIVICHYYLCTLGSRTHSHQIFITSDTNFEQQTWGNVFAFHAHAGLGM